MSIITNDTAHTASLTNEAVNGRTLGQYTMAELANDTLAELADYNFTSIFFEFTNDTAHTASPANEPSH